MLPPSIPPTIPTAPPLLDVSIAVAPARLTAPVRVTLPRLPPSVSIAVVIVPLVEIVPAVIETALISALAPIFLTLAVPVPASRVTSVAVLPSVPMMSPPKVILASHL